MIAPAIPTELFTIPIGNQRYVIYAPLRRAAFVANARAVNFAADLQAGRLNQADDPDDSLVELLRRLEILDAGAEELPVTEYSGDPEPTSVTLFLTTACNLRCTYCYASAGDTPTKHMTLNWGDGQTPLLRRPKSSSPHIGKHDHLHVGLRVTHPAGGRMHLRLRARQRTCLYATSCAPLARRQRWRRWNHGLHVQPRVHVRPNL